MTSSKFETNDDILDFVIKKVNGIKEATTKWGCFQIINLGISIEVLEDLKDVAHKFFQLPAEEKVNYCKDSYSAGESVLMFWSAIEPLLMGTMKININYYPPCPNPSITIGAHRHCNGSGITLIFQDDMGDLYVRGTKGDNWIHVNPIKGALVVNIGDLLQIISNDRYKRIEHCVAVDLSRARISVSLFVNTRLDSVIGQFSQIMKDGEKPVYKPVLHSDY
ncbi:hypothetical protein MTR67_025814 [Solanum verrucosum]|uniref:Fe2OG dioxygenase domain-containing protein n=1 Tax=Solanum verrucosum TaxID=315347 RepID=A0AAF0QXT5_SOLVR|nr:hypothetical protein MTR67_025814 [Solanum verrucosum]